MDRFLEKFNLSSLKQEEIEIMNNPVTSTEIETLIKYLQNKQTNKQKTLDQMASQENSIKHQRTANDKLSKTLKNAEEGTLPNSF